MTEEKQMLDKLNRISNKLQKQITDLETSFDMAIPLAKNFGCSFDRKTGVLLKL